MLRKNTAEPAQQTLKQYNFAADRGGVSADQAGDPPYACPVVDLYLDDLPFLFRQVRMHLTQGATPFHWLSGQSPNCAVSLASAALHKHKDDDITDEEINSGLPPSLRKECKK